jgi:TRAP-type uncharacterized transport system substrate-binding protein
MNSTNIIAICLALFIIVYLANDIIIPGIKAIIKSYKNNNSLDSFTEHFTQYSSLIKGKGTSSLTNTVQFDTNYYLRDSNKPIIINNKISLPVITYCYFSIGSYEDLIGKYFKKHIYPIEPVRAITNIDAIYKFINNEIDIAFISEEILTRYIKRDCKYLNRLLAESFNIKNPDFNNPELMDQLYPPINISAIGVGFNTDFYMIVNNFSNIVEFQDITKKKIAVLSDSYYFFIKICSAYNLDMKIMNITIEPNLEDLLSNFVDNKYDGIFIVAHPKNKQLLKLSIDMKIRFIHIQKRDHIDVKFNNKNLINDQQGNNPILIPRPPSEQLQLNYTKQLEQDKKTENITITFNQLIKKYFHRITPRSVDLNKFHTSGNIYTYLETFTSRMILLIRNDIPPERVEYITKNYINNLEKLRNTIDLEQFNIQLNNFSSLEFKYDELVSFDESIPLAKGSQKVYKEEGLIYYLDETKCVT